METGVIIGVLVLLVGLVLFAKKKSDQKKNSKKYTGEVGQFPDPNDR